MRSAQQLRRPGVHPTPVHDLQCAKWHWVRFFSQYFRFPPSVSFHQYSSTSSSHRQCHSTNTPILPVPTVSAIPPTSHACSAVHHRRYVMLATGIVSNTRHKVMLHVTTQPWTCMHFGVISCLKLGSFSNANIQSGPHREHSPSLL
jgi:hypothetical protein